jgi:hypothetical protein
MEPLRTQLIQAYPPIFLWQRPTVKPFSGPLLTVREPRCLLTPINENTLKAQRERPKLQPICNLELEQTLGRERGPGAGQVHMRQIFDAQALTLTRQGRLELVGMPICPYGRE